MGFDQPGQVAKVDYADIKTYPDFWQGMATTHAVYDFLERYCGVRWYGPGDLGTVADARPTLVVTGSPDEIRRKPLMTTRNYEVGKTLMGQPVQIAAPEDTVTPAVTVQVF
jgi:hypothetical protein